MWTHVCTCIKQRLQLELSSARPLVESLNEAGSRLRTLSPGEGAMRVEDALNRDNKKFDALSDQVQRRADKIQLQKQKSLEVSFVCDTHFVRPT